MAGEHTRANENGGILRSLPEGPPQARRTAQGATGRSFDAGSGGRTVPQEGGTGRPPREENGTTASTTESRRARRRRSPRRTPTVEVAT